MQKKKTKENTKYKPSKAEYYTIYSNSFLVSYGKNKLYYTIIQGVAMKLM